MTKTYGLLVVALGVASAVLSGCKSEAHTQSAPPPEVSVIEVKPGPVTVYNEYVAQTQAPDTIEIRAQVTGLLERQAFADGARVKKGDLLYVIDQRPFEAQAAQARAGLAQAEANLLNAKQNLARNARLIAEKAVSQQDYDTAVAQERASTAVVEAQKALSRNSELNLEFATIRASRDGFMSSSQVKPGALITAQQTLLTTLYSSDPMWAYFSLSEDRLLELQKTKSVYVVGADDKIEPRQIVTSHRLDNEWVVSSGLAAGDRVVVEGTSKVRPGAPVRPVALASASKSAK